MTSVDLSKKALSADLGRSLVDEEITRALLMLGTEVDGVNAQMITCDVPPNRPDLLSQQGMTRALSSFLSLKTGLRSYAARSSSYEVHIDPSVKEVRPQTCCAVVKGLHFDDEGIRELVQVQEKLHITFGRMRKKLAIGIYPLDKITFPLSFVGKDPKSMRFLALDAPREMDGLELLRTHPTGREYAHLLDGKKTFPFFVDKAGQVLSMPPIINAEALGRVDESTTEVFIECSGFDRRVLSLSLNMVVTTLADRGGDVHEVTVLDGGEKKTYPDFSASERELETAYVNQRLGSSLSDAQAVSCLEQMGYGASVSSPGTLSVQVPCYRADVLHPIDLVEDIMIAHGLEQLSPEIPKVATVAAEDPLQVFSRRVARILVGFGLLETTSYELMSRDEATTKMCQEHADLVELSNAVTVEYDVLRPSLLPSLLLVLSRNKHHAYPQSLFESGVVFRRDDTKETRVCEGRRLGFLFADAKADFTKARQVLDGLLRALAIPVAYGSSFDDRFVPGRSATIKTQEGTTLGTIGELHPRVLRAFSVFVPCAAFELDMQVLFSLVNA